MFFSNYKGSVFQKEVTFTTIGQMTEAAIKSCCVKLISFEN